MAYNETRITVVGAVASQVTHVKVGAAQTSRAVFRVISTERVYDRDQQTYMDGDKLFMTVTCWRRLADNVHASLNKGDPVVLTGRMRIKDVDYEGGTRQVVDIEAVAVGPNLLWCTATAQRTRAAPEEQLPLTIVAPRKEGELGSAAPNGAAAATPGEVDQHSKEVAEVPF